MGVKRPGREANHSPPSSAEVKEYVELYFHSQYVFMTWCLVKHRDFTFTFTFDVREVKYETVDSIQLAQDGFH
jgi:hypothetical protein